MRDSVVTYGDTDSLFLNYDVIMNRDGYKHQNHTKEEIIKKCLSIDQRVESVIESTCDHLTKDIMLCDDMFVFETEEQIERILLSSKKKYIARVCYDKTNNQFVDDLIVKGLDFKKSNLSESVKEFLKEMTIKIMDGVSEPEICKLLEKKFYELPTLPIEEIAYVQGIRNIKKYETGANIIIKNQKDALAYFPNKCPFHVSGALVMNALIDYDPDLREMSKVTEGQKCQIVFVTPNNIFGVKGISLAQGQEFHPKLYEYFSLDVEYLFNRLILGPLQPSLNTVNYKTDLDGILGYKFLDSENKVVQTLLF